MAARNKPKKSKGTVRTARRRPAISHGDRILFPDAGITKAELVEYYRQIAAVMLPHVRERPLTMQRFPNGIEGEGFFQKETPDYFPEWIETARIRRKEGGWTRYVLCNKAETLEYVANQGCITPHVWLSRREKWDFPDRMVFDLDPQADDFGAVRQGAKELRKVLEEIGIRAMPMLTGSRGVHVVAPLDRRMNFDEAREFARDAAGIVVQNHRADFTMETRKKKRAGRLFIDTLRNGYAQTMVAPYAVRAKPGAPVVAPITWEELEDVKSSQEYTTRSIFERLAKNGDPWKEGMKRANSPARARKRLLEMKEAAGSAAV